MCSEQTDRDLQSAGIDTVLTLVHFLAQISEETGGGVEIVENLNYSAEGLLRTWPSRFNSETAAEFAHKPEAIANRVYNARMGNQVGSNDGWNFRGRGASQCTGREGYEKLAKLTGLDVVNHPDLVNEPDHFMLCGAMDFVACGCLPYAKPHEGHPKGDVVMVTKRLNGGVIGLSSRQSWFAAWSSVYKDLNVELTVAPVSHPEPVKLVNHPVVSEPVSHPAEPKPEPVKPETKPEQNLLGEIGHFFTNLKSKI